MKTNPVLFSASELLTAYSNKTLSPVEVTKATLDHIVNYDEKVNMFRVRGRQREGPKRIAIGPDGLRIV